MCLFRSLSYRHRSNSPLIAELREHQQCSGPENQDSQRKPNQPRRASPPRGGGRIKEGGDIKFLSREAPKNSPPPPCTRVKWVPFVLWRFFPCFIVFVVSKLAIFPLQRHQVFWELDKAIFGPEKDKWWIWGSKTPKPPEMPLKQGKRHNTTTGLATWIAPKLGQKVL